MLPNILKKSLTLLAVLLAAAALHGQTVERHGTVSQASDGAPIAGATVMVEGGSDATVTGPKGDYSIIVK